MVIPARAVSPQTTVAEVVQILLANASWHALAVVDGTLPIGIIGRTEMLSQASKPYFAEVFGKRSCLRYANMSPRVIEIDQDVRDLVGILTSEDQRYLSEGFIYTENGQYAGIGQGEHLVRLVTESRVEAARHANPLTFLPGNIPISEHLARLLDRKSSFTVAYADLANFKPFNDYYGYWQGDEAIKLVATTLLKHLDRKLDFLGHVGGDDFLIIFQSLDWFERLTAAIAEFNRTVVALHDAEAIKSGGIWSEDRHGIKRFFPSHRSMPVRSLQTPAHSKVLRISPGRRRAPDRSPRRKTLRSTSATPLMTPSMTSRNSLRFNPASKAQRRIDL